MTLLSTKTLPPTPETSVLQSAESSLCFQSLLCCPCSRWVPIILADDGASAPQRSQQWISPRTQAALTWHRSVPPVSITPASANQNPQHCCLKGWFFPGPVLMLKGPPQSCPWLFPSYPDWKHELWLDYFYSKYDSLHPHHIPNERRMSRLFYHVNLIQKNRFFKKSVSMFKEYMQGVNIFEFVYVSHIMNTIFILLKAM